MHASGMIDTHDPVNIAFLQKHAKTADQPASQKTAKAIRLVDIPSQETGNSDDDGEDIDWNTDDSDGDEETGGIPPMHVSEKKLKHLDTVKRAKEIDKLKLEIQKKRGEVVPVEPIEVLVFQFKQKVLTHFKMGAEAILNEITHKYSITSEDMAYYRGFMTNKLNECVREASTEFVEGFDVALNEFAIKKAVGERQR